MASIVRSVAASADDAVQSAATFATELTQTAPNIDGASYTFAGKRFLNITLVAGDTVTNAVINHEVTSSGNDEPDIRYAFEKVANSAQFTTAVDNLFNRFASKTTATVLYQSANLGAPGFFNTPDLSACVTEVKNQGSWASGNAMTALEEAVGSSARDWAPSHYDAASSQEPILTITYTPAASGNPHYYYQQQTAALAS